MRPSPPPTPLDWSQTPAQAFRAWPRSRPLAALWSGDDSPQAASWSRWTILAQPTGASVSSPSDPDPLSLLPRAPDTSLPVDPDHPPFQGGWIAHLAYSLGRRIEPAATSSERPVPDDPWPDLVLLRCPAVYAHDARTGRWWAVGEPEAVASLPFATASPLAAQDLSSQGFAVTGLHSRTGRAAYEAALRRTLDHIRAGDIYQANITHRLSGGFDGSARAFFLALAAAARPWYGAYLELPTGPGRSRRILASASPELFLRFDPVTRRVVTRPMKGTRPGGDDPGELLANAKENAELTMIIDLMRNDLGRVARVGSVRVDERRVVEHHASARGAGGSGGAGVLQAVATVSAELEAGLGLADLLRATFPGGSVTGAPKIRAMQIIEALEPVDRGPYCGCIGYVSTSGHAAFSIAIRTAAITSPSRPSTAAADPEALDAIEGGRLDYGVGAGIVADSDPAAEWRETLHKAGVLAAAAAPQPVPP